MDGTVRGTFQARILESVAFLFSRGSSQPRDRTQVSCIAGGFFNIWTTREAQEHWSGEPIPSSGDLPDPGIEPRSPALQADSLPTQLWGKIPRENKKQLKLPIFLGRWNKVEPLWKNLAVHYNETYTFTQPRNSTHILLKKNERTSYNDCTQRFRAILLIKLQTRNNQNPSAGELVMESGHIFFKKYQSSPTPEKKNKTAWILKHCAKQKLEV